MDIKGFLKKSFEKLVGGYFYTSNLNQYNRNGLAPDYSKADLLKLYSSWAYICASRNATAISAVPLKLYATRATGEQKARRSARMLTKSERFRLNKNPMLQKNSRYKAAEDVEEILDHPFLDLMNRVNNQRNSFETIEETSIFMDCTGDAYWNIERNMLGVPESIYLLPSQLVTIVPDEKEFIKGYLYGNNPAKRIAFEPEEIIQFRMPNPKNIYYGLSCIEASIMAVERYKAMDEYEQSLNKNMGVPPLLIRYKTGNLTPEKRRELEIEWNRMMRGVGNAGKTKVADMDWDVVPLGIEPRDIGFEIGRKFTRLEIADAFGVPLALLDTENVNRANADAALYQYQAFTILPRLRRIEQKLNEQLIPMYDEPRLFVAYENNVPEDKEFDLKQDDIYLRNGVVTVNEVRSKDGLDPVEWGDEPYQAQSQGSLITQDGNQIKLRLKKDWVTINGSPVFIGEDGQPQYGGNGGGKPDSEGGSSSGKPSYAKHSSDTVSVAENGQIKMKNPKTPKEAMEQMDTMSRMMDDADADVRNASQDERGKAVLRQQHVRSQFARCLGKAKTLVNGMKDISKEKILERIKELSEKYKITPSTIKDDHELKHFIRC